LPAATRLFLSSHVPLSWIALSRVNEAERGWQEIKRTRGGSVNCVRLHRGAGLSCMATSALVGSLVMNFLLTLFLLLGTAIQVCMRTLYWHIRHIHHLISGLARLARRLQIVGRLREWLDKLHPAEILDKILGLGISPQGGGQRRASDPFVPMPHHTNTLLARNRNQPSTSPRTVLAIPKCLLVQFSHSSRATSSSYACSAFPYSLHVCDLCFTQVPRSSQRTGAYKASLRASLRQETERARARARESESE